ncbi:MAG: hypothetical protein KF773_31795 [Deltaproteobacteria bacterium]|nr:hypothetical protein [Deltaproteobacteria bacterium]MCW5809157.1 hypothetical protein [Deltaproteobacteria bacterium]
MLRPGITALTLACLVEVARANPASTVPSAADPGNAIDLHLSIDYAYELAQATLFREQLSPSNDPLGPLPEARELDFKQSRHVITPRAELAIYNDTWLWAALPIIVAQERELTLADGATRDGLSTIADGLLPAQGFDARDGGGATAGNLLFRGASRSGLDQVYLGLGIAPMSQKRDPTKPTWKLGAELRLAVGRVMRFDALAPAKETGVGRGVHELRLMTSVGKRFARSEGWFEMFWQTPLIEKEASLFGDPGFGSTNTQLGQIAGASFGGEIYALADRVNHNYISFDFGASVIAHFEGRDYSEMWEVFALAGDSRGGGPLILDRDPTMMGVQPLSHPGISNIENYLENVARFAVRAQLGQHVRFSLGVNLVWKTDHIISFADAGVDLPTCGGGVSSACENDVNDLVNPNTREVNPVAAPRIDLVGHRYHSENNFGVVFGLQGQVLW